MPTIRDVARESGVSVATVSYVLNDGPRPVRAETRQRVLDVMRRLDYHPNAVARGLARRRMNTLGVLFGSVEPAVVTNPYAIGVLQGVLTMAASCGFDVSLFTQPWRGARRSAAAFRDRRTDGVLLIAPLLDSDMVSGLAALGRPLVVVSARADEHGVTSVGVDDARGARLATEFLLGLGHTRIAHLKGDPRQASTLLRGDAFSAAMAAASVAVRDEYVVTCNYDPGQSYAATKALLALPQPPTAIFAGNDAMALAALEAARDVRVSVPHDISIVGFDDIAAASQVTPPLTTVRQPLSQIGEEATRLLIACVEGKPVPATAHVLEPELIARGSAAPPSSS